MTSLYKIFQNIFFPSIPTNKERKRLKTRNPISSLPKYKGEVVKSGNLVMLLTILLLFHIELDILITSSIDFSFWR